MPRRRLLALADRRARLSPDRKARSGPGTPTPLQAQACCAHPLTRREQEDASGKAGLALRLTPRLSLCVHRLPSLRSAETATKAVVATPARIREAERAGVSAPSKEQGLAAARGAQTRPGPPPPPARPPGRGPRRPGDPETRACADLLPVTGTNTAPASESCRRRPPRRGRISRRSHSSAENASFSL